MLFPCIRYAEYGLAKMKNLELAAMLNGAGNFVRPDEVLLGNITEVFGGDFVLPNSLTSAAWANVSLMSSSKPCHVPIATESIP